MRKIVGSWGGPAHEAGQRRTIRALLALFLVLILSVVLSLFTGCTRFEVTTQQGITVKSSGAVLVTRQDSFVVSHQWLDESTNTLHEIRITRATDENADAQLRALEMAFQAGRAAAPVVP